MQKEETTVALGDGLIEARMRLRNFVYPLREVTGSAEFWFGWAVGIATAIVTVVGSVLIVHLIID